MAKEQTTDAPEAAIKATGKTYRMTAWAAKKWPTAVTSVNGQTVAIGPEPVTVTMAATKDGPEKKRTVPAATQEQLRWLFMNEAHPFIEEVAEK